MTPNLSRLAFLAAGVALTATALAGPDATDAAPSDARRQPVVKWHQQVVDKVLVACGVVEPPPVYVAPGYLETTGPAPMLVYRPPGPMRPRRVTHPEGEEKPAAAATLAPSPAPSHAADPAPSPAPAPATAPVPTAPVPAPAPAAAEPGVLPETDANASAARNHTDELLSYFQRQHAVAHPYTAAPVAPGDASPNDPSAEPSFLQAPQAPEQPVLPPSRATYHVAP